MTLLPKGMKIHLGLDLIDMRKSGQIHLRTRSAHRTAKVMMFWCCRLSDRSGGSRLSSLERAILLLRNDWHSSVNGALLGVLGPARIGSGYAPRR